MFESSSIKIHGTAAVSCCDCIHWDPDDFPYCSHENNFAAYAASCFLAGIAIDALDCPGFEAVDAELEGERE